MRLKQACSGSSYYLIPIAYQNLDFHGTAIAAFNSNNINPIFSSDVLDFVIPGLLSYRVTRQGLEYANNSFTNRHPSYSSQRYLARTGQNLYELVPTLHPTLINVSHFSSVEFLTKSWSNTTSPFGYTLITVLPPYLNAPRHWPRVTCAPG